MIDHSHVYLSLQVAGGLSHLHEYNIVYYDLKSPNVLVFQFPSPQESLQQVGQPVGCLTHLLTCTSSHTKAGSQYNTIAYIAVCMVHCEITFVLLLVSYCYSQICEGSNCCSANVKGPLEIILCSYRDETDVKTICYSFCYTAMSSIVDGSRHVFVEKHLYPALSAHM